MSDQPTRIEAASWTAPQTFEAACVHCGQGERHHYVVSQYVDATDPMRGIETWKYCPLSRLSVAARDTQPLTPGDTGTSAQGSTTE